MDFAVPANHWIKLKECEKKDEYCNRASLLKTKEHEKDIETRLTKAWTAINRLSTIWKSDLTDKMKRSFFQAAVTSILLYGCTTWTLTKRLEKKLDGNYTRMLRAILNKSWQQHPTRHQLYGHLPPITKTIQVRRTRHAGHCWRSRDELIRDVLLWITTHGRAKAGRPARTYIQQLCEDTGCCPEDLPRAMNDREEWRERVRDIRAASTIWWWWRNMKVIIVPVVIGALVTVIKVLLKALEWLEDGGRVETIQTTALMRTARILKKVLDTCCHSDSRRKP